MRTHFDSARKFILHPLIYTRLLSNTPQHLVSRQRSLRLCVLHLQPCAQQAQQAQQWFQKMVRDKNPRQKVVRREGRIVLCEIVHLVCKSNVQLSEVIPALAQAALGGWGVSKIRAFGKIFSWPVHAAQCRGEL